ncbi:hypothetical protein NEHOM01_1916 [Nematocida homosporus]|uniref:uncharacterized protein n=1 Tax=Nematocida homosporus TaxID=1912981 RepID=UPI00221EFCC5|nr:uncharacterized protein NEHOM01_1916 [Nematocida homosporus]KAI5187083.1 hypothetical protein NEHOM01_1916 [Nematocida homosporus]
MLLICLSLILFTKTMTLSLYMKNLSSLYAQNTPILTQSILTQSILTQYSKPILTQSIPTQYNANLIRRTTLGLAILLVLLNWTVVVNASNQIAKEKIEVLNSIGFSWQCPHDESKLNITFCSPQYPFEPVSDANLAQRIAAQETPLKYTVELLNDEIKFTLPPELDSIRAKAVLEELQNIIEFKAEVVWIMYIENNQADHILNMQILSRAVNLFECQQLHLELNPNLEMDHLDTNPILTHPMVCREEAQNTYSQINYMLPCTLFSCYRLSEVFEKFLACKVLLLRPISGLKLVGDWGQDISFVNRLSLKQDYTLRFDPWGCKNDAKLDFGLLQQSPVRCGMVLTQCSDKLYDQIIGLENTADKHPELTLAVKWDTIMTSYPFDRLHPQTTINVHTLLLLDAGNEAIKQMNYISKLEHTAPSWIKAKKLICEFNDGVPCNFLSYYQALFTPTALAKLSITVDEVELVYSKIGRTNLQDTLNALFPGTKFPEMEKPNPIMCCGDALSGTIELMEPVNFSSDFECYDYYKDYFCQHLRYTTINLDGNKTISLKNAYQCTQLLMLFRNINATELQISNTFGSVNCPFDLQALHMAKSPGLKYQLNISKLVLDNTPECLFNWILDNYEFVCPIEIYIRNHQLNNLAVVKILAHEEARNITKLVIVGLLGLSEAEPASQGNKTDEFSLPNYIKAYEGKKTTQELGLHKLFMVPGCINIGQHI